MKVYGDWFDDAMLARAKRDKLSPLHLRRAIIAVRHYAVRGYFVTLPSGEVVTWTMRRDGRIGESWVPLPAKVVLAAGFLGEDIELPEGVVS